MKGFTFLGEIRTVKFTLPPYFDINIVFQSMAVARKGSKNRCYNQRFEPESFG